MPQFNVRPSLYITVLRDGYEYGLSAALPFQPGVTETLIVRVRNANPYRLTAMGSVRVTPNGHTINNAVVWGHGNVDTQSRMVGPSLCVDRYAGLGNVSPGVRGANFIIPAGKYAELQLECTWGNTPGLPIFSFGPESAAAGVPVFRIEGAGPDRIVPLGMTEPIVPGEVPEVDEPAGD